MGEKWERWFAYREDESSRMKFGRLPRTNIYLTIWMKPSFAFNAIGIVYFGDALIGKCMVIVVSQVTRLIMRDTNLFLEAGPSSWESVICRVEDCTI